jgi:hypothetical protein
VWVLLFTLQIKCSSFRDNTYLVMRQLIIICLIIISSCNVFQIELYIFAQLRPNLPAVGSRHKSSESVDPECIVVVVKLTVLTRQ